MVQLKHAATVVTPPECSFQQKIEAIAWSPNRYRLAVATADRVVLLFDEDLKLRDRIPLRPNENCPRNFLVRGLAWSPDSQRLAVAQSDQVVYVYKLGKTWAEKKTICNKFDSDSPVTCITWPSQRVNECVFGTVSGHLRVGILKTNKTADLFRTDTCAVACAPGFANISCPPFDVSFFLLCRPNGNSFISAHQDGSVYRYTFGSAEGRPPSYSQLVRPGVDGAQTGVPFAVSWGQHVVVAGTDHFVRFYDPNSGKQIQQFDYSASVHAKFIFMRTPTHTLVSDNYTVTIPSRNSLLLRILHRV